MSTIEKDVKSIRNMLTFAFAMLLIYLAEVLASLLIPFAMALFLAILVQPILVWFDKKRIPFGVSASIVSISSLALLGLIGMLIYQTIKSLAQEEEELSAQVSVKLDGVLTWLSDLTGIEIQEGLIKETIANTFTTDWLLQSTDKITGFLGNFTGFLGSFTGSFLMTSIYFVAVLGVIFKYDKYITYLEGPENNGAMLKAFEKVKQSIVSYMKVKFLTSLCTGVSFGVISWAFGLEFSLFWGFLAFILNFIPTVGSVVATIPPLLLALVVIPSGSMILFFALLLVTVQFIFGNVVEPKLLGSSLSLNTVIVILGLVFWGYLWGVIGMILSVPLMVLIKVVLEQLPEAQMFAKLLGSSSDQDATSSI